MAFQRLAGCLGAGCTSIQRKWYKVEGAAPLNRILVPLFNSRKQRWAEHFVWSDDFTLLVGLTPTGGATVATLQMDHQKMVNLRRLLGLAGLHP